MADKFEDLRTYATIVERRGVNAAAAELGIAKSAVSRRLSDLEARLGVTLVERSRRGFEVTSVGREYYEKAIEILGSLDRLDRGIGAPGDRGELVIAAPPPILVHLVVPALTRIRAAWPDLAVTLDFPEGAADADVLVDDRDADERQIAIEVGPTRMVACASPAYLAERGTPAATSDLASHALVAVGSPSRGEWRSSASDERPEAIIPVPDAETALAAALAGLGLAMLPDFVAAEALRDGRLAEVRWRGTGAGSLRVIHDRDAVPAARRLADELGRALRARG